MEFNIEKNYLRAIQHLQYLVIANEKKILLNKLREADLEKAKKILEAKYLTVDFVELKKILGRNYYADNLVDFKKILGRIYLTNSLGEFKKIEDAIKKIFEANQKLYEECIESLSICEWLTNRLSTIIK